MEQNLNFLSIYPFPALLTPPLPTPFTTEEITGCTNEAAKDGNRAPNNPTPYRFMDCPYRFISESIG